MSLSQVNSPLSLIALKTANSFLSYLKRQSGHCTWYDTDFSKNKLTAFALFLICISSKGCFECLLNAVCAFCHPSFVIPCPFSALRPFWISTRRALINSFSISGVHVARSGFEASFSLPFRVIVCASFFFFRGRVVAHGRRSGGRGGGMTRLAHASSRRRRRQRQRRGRGTVRKIFHYPELSLIVVPYRGRDV